MFFGYRTGVALTSLVLAATLRAAAAPPHPPCVAVEHLYSARALRRMRTLLQLRLLELREQRLTIAEEVVRRQISVDELIRGTSQRKGGREATKLKQSVCLHATTYW